VVAAGGGLIAFGMSRQLERLATPINVFDALGLSLFAVTGATKALGLGAGAGQAILLGAITAVGGGTIRDVLVRRIPTVLRSELYAIPALLGAAVVVVAARLSAAILVPALVGAGLCFLVRLLGLGFRLDAPHPPGRGVPEEPEEGS
jgi:uncharacterized membrane protein YeiH